MPEDSNKKFVREPKFGPGAIVALILGAIVVFGALAYMLIAHGDALSLPRPGQ